MDFSPSSSTSPSNILLLTLLLISHFPIYGYARVKAFHIIGDKSFQSACAFDLGHYSFNLCPLAETATVTTKDHMEETSSGTRIYEVALGGMQGLRLPTSGLVCDSNTWVCMTDGMSIDTQGSDEHVFLSKNKSRRRKTQVTRIARKKRATSRHGNIIASIVTKDADSIGFSPLKLFLDGGEAEGRPQFARIDMICDVNVDSYLEFINERDGIHSFRWTTRHGCPTNVKSMFMQSSRLSTRSDDEPNDESENNKGDDELLPQQGTNTARRWIAVVVVMIVLCSFLFIASPRARHLTGETILSLFHSLIPILSTAAIKLQPVGRTILTLSPKSLLRRVGKPFRQGSNQLVTWAEEDMMLPESDDMVNGGGGAYGRENEEGWNGIELNEFLPLAGSRRGKSYGATPDVETFEERGLAGGFGRLFGK